MPKVDLNLVPSFYHNYIAMVQQETLQQALTFHASNILPLLQGLPVEKWDHAYAPGKWTIKELVQHLIDAERIFAYRALRFARHDETELPGFDENSYAQNSKAGRRQPMELMQELETVQSASVQLFRSFSEEDLECSGIANGNPIYVKAIGFILVGHVLHHRAVLESRYLA